MDCRKNASVDAASFMFERAGPWPFILGWLGCNSSHTSDWILLGIFCWLCGFLFGCALTAVILSRSVRNILWSCLGAAVRELHTPGGGDRLARYRGVHGHTA